MKLLLCSLNSKYIHSSLGVWYLFAAVKEAKINNLESKVYEGTINKNIDEMFEDILAERPDILGFSCYIWNIKHIMGLAEKLKESLPQVKIIFGGPEVSYNQGDILNSCSYVDYIISGEGEAPIVELTSALVEAKSNFNITGVSYRVSKTENSIGETSISCDDPPNPYVEEYFLSLNNRIVYFETSRGCPFSCAFCLSGRCGGLRFFDLEECFERLIKLSNSGTKTIKFVDRTFNANSKRAEKIVEFIIENYGNRIPSGICFHFEIAGDILSEGLIKLFQNAPKASIQLEIGLQSFNEKTLEAVTRKTDNEKLKKNILALLKNQNIHVHIDLIAGLPFEDLLSFKESFNTAYSLRPHMLQLGFLKILHGAQMGENKEQFPCTYSKEPPYQVVSTPWLNEDELEVIHVCENALDKFYSSGRFLISLEYMLEKSNPKPFDLFYTLGTIIETAHTPHEVCELLIDAVQNLGLNTNELRDKLVIDWLSFNASGKLPPALRQFDDRLKKIAIKLDENKDTRREKNVKRGIAILNSVDTALWVDYKEKNAVSGRYKIHFIEEISKWLEL